MYFFLFESDNWLFDGVSVKETAFIMFVNHMLNHWLFFLSPLETSDPTENKVKT